MKKHKSLFAFLGLSILATGLLVSATLSDPLNLAGLANQQHSIVLNKTTNPVIGLDQNIDIENQNFFGGNDLKYKVVSSKDKSSFELNVKTGFINPDGYVILGSSGYLGNRYVFNSTYHNRINGLESITVNYTGIDDKTPAYLAVSYSFEEYMIDNHAYLDCDLIASGKPYDFKGKHPNYFSIYPLLTYAPVAIKDIVITYSCSEVGQQLPTNTFYNSGYTVGAIKGRDTLETAYKGVANNVIQARQMLESAIMGHYQFATITHNYNHDESYDRFCFERADLTHVTTIPYGDYLNGENVTNTYAIIYEGAKGINNDLIFNGDPNYQDDSEYAAGFSFDTASYHSIVKGFPVAENLENSNAKLRKEAYAETFKARPSNYDNFPINNYPKIDVRNSEELWWAAANHYQPNFVIENSKAEWMYKEAKQILNSIIYEGMDNYQKIQAIYDWIVGHNRYDWDSVYSARHPHEHVCYFLEGVLEDRAAVCDSFSKVMVLLSQMEGLDVIRGFGFTAEGNGHAWAYARTNPDEPYYLVCPTWGSETFEIAEGEDAKWYCGTNYMAFMTARDFFADANGEESNFVELMQSPDSLSQTTYPENVYKKDKLPNYQDYDFYIDSLPELTACIKEADRVCEGSFSLAFGSPTEISVADIKSIMNETGIDLTTYKTMLITKLSYKFNHYTFAAVKA